jgi:hypothetical protein
MPLAKVPSYIDDKAISGSVLPPQKDYLDFVIQFQPEQF